MASDDLKYRTYRTQFYGAFVPFIDLKLKFPFIVIACKRVTSTVFKISPFVFHKTASHTVLDLHNDE